MKGKTIARKAREHGWHAEVNTSSDGSYTVYLRLTTREHNSFLLPDYCYPRDIAERNKGGLEEHVHLFCDKDGEVVRASRTTKEEMYAGEWGDPGGWVHDLVTCHPCNRNRAERTAGAS